MASRISQRLWMGLGLLLGLFIAKPSWAQNAPPGAGDFSCELEKADGTPAAVGPAMHEYLDDLWRAAQVYVETRDKRQLLRLADARRGFETALQSCRASTASPLSERRGYDLRQSFSRYKRHAHELIEVVDAQASRRESYQRHQAQVSALLHSMPFSVAPGRQGAAEALKLDAIRAATQSLVEQAERPGSEPSNNHMALADNGTARALAQYGRLAATVEERRWAAQAMGWWVEANRRAAAVAEGEEGMRHTLAELAESRRAVHAVLARAVQPAATGLASAAPLLMPNRLVKANALIARSDAAPEAPTHNQSFAQMMAVVIGLAVVTVLALVRLLNLPVYPTIPDKDDKDLVVTDLRGPGTRAEHDGSTAATTPARPEVTYLARR